MTSLTIIITEAPYGNEKTWNAMRLANVSASVDVGMKIRVFLMVIPF